MRGVQIRGGGCPRLVVFVGILAVTTIGCDVATASFAASRAEDRENTAIDDPTAELKTVEILLPPEVPVPLGGLAEPEITIRRDRTTDDLEISVDAAPGLVIVPATVTAWDTVPQVRLGAAAPLAVGARLTLRVTATARSGTLVAAAVTRAVVVERPGSLDASFGDAGMFHAGGGKTGFDAFSDLQVQPDDSVLATGQTNWRMGEVLRATHLRPDGRPDPSWDAAPRDEIWSGVHRGSAGLVLPAPNRRATGFAIRRQSMGRVIVAGTQLRDRKSDRIILAGILPQGGLDAAFGENGLRFSPPERDDAGALAMALAPDDALIVGGYQGRRALVARFTPDGTPDPGFAEGGLATLDPLHGAAAQVNGVALDAAGRILAVGAAGSRAFVARLLPDGSTDGFFHPELSTPEPTDDATARSVALLPDGGLLVSGVVRRGSTAFAAVWRLSERGLPDPSFGTGGTGGLATVPVFGARDPLGGFTLLPDGRCVLAVNVDERDPGEEEHSKPYLVRLLPGGRPDAAFGSRGFVRVAVRQGNVVLSLAHAGDDKLLLGFRLQWRGGARYAGIARIWD
jgi:uncharacterized delta-60 repeat protein